MVNRTGISLDRDLTDKQRMFCESYLTNGRKANAAARQAGYSNPKVRAHFLLGLPRVVKYMQDRVQKLEKDMVATFDWKLKKLVNVVEKFIPDEQEDIGKGVIYGMSAITELNKMQGHYAAEKHVNISVDGDKHLARVKELTEKAILEHKRDY